MRKIVSEQNIPHSLTHSLTPWSRVLPEKLTCHQLVKKSPHFIEPKGSLPHSQEPSTCPCLEPDPCLHSTSWKSILIIYSNLSLGLQSGLFPSGLLIKILCAYLLAHSTCYMPFLSHSYWFDHRKIFGEKYGSKAHRHVVYCSRVVPAVTDAQISSLILVTFPVHFGTE
jgi:hypothetical protein